MSCERAKVVFHISEHPWAFGRTSLSNASHRAPHSTRTSCIRATPHLERTCDSLCSLWQRNRVSVPKLCTCNLFPFPPSLAAQGTGTCPTAGFRVRFKQMNTMASYTTVNNANHCSNIHAGPLTIYSSLHTLWYAIYIVTLRNSPVPAFCVAMFPPFPKYKQCNSTFFGMCPLATEQLLALRG